jgi:hypothetical protein
LADVVLLVGGDACRLLTFVPVVFAAAKINQGSRQGLSARAGLERLLFRTARTHAL